MLTSDTTVDGREPSGDRAPDLSMRDSGREGGLNNMLCSSPGVPGSGEATDSSPFGDFTGSSSSTRALDPPSIAAAGSTRVVIVLLLPTY